MMKNLVNYIKLFIVIIVTILLTVIVCNLYRNYEKNKGNESYIAKYVSTIKYNDLKNTITELNTNSFIYLSYTGDNRIFDFEKKLRKVLRQYDLEDNFIYVDCTSLVNKNTNTISNILTIDNLTLPAIIYFKDGNPVDYINSKNGLINESHFAQLLDKYEIERGR